MSTRIGSSANNIYKKLRDYIDDPGWIKFCEDRWDIITDYSRDGREVGRVSVAMTLASMWHFRQSVVLLAAGDPTGVDCAHLAACAQFLGSDIARQFRALLPKDRRRPLFSIEHSSFALGAFITLGAMTAAARMYDLQMSYLHDGLFMEVNQFLYPQYLFALFASWKGEKLTLDQYGFRPMGTYGDLLAVWDSSDEAEVSTALAAACDLHIARSRNSNNKESFDFDLEYTRVLPFEIMSVLRLREMRGLPNPTDAHPLLKIPTARLFPVQETPWDPRLLAAYERACAELAERGRVSPPD